MTLAPAEERLLTPTQAAEKYLTKMAPGCAPDYPRLAKAFARYAEANGGDLNRRMVESYIHDRRRAGCADSTLRKEFDNIKRMFDANKIDWPYAKREGPPHSDMSRPRFMPEVDDVHRLIKAAAQIGAEHMAVLALSTTYGCRRVEMSWFFDREGGRWSGIGPNSFDWHAPTVFVETAKGGRKRHHLIPEEIQPVLQAYDWRPRSPSTVSKIFQEIRRQAGGKLKGVAYHAIRAAIDDLLEDGGFKPSELRLFLRWSTNTSMEVRYASRKRVSIFGPPQGKLEMPTLDEELDRRAFELNPWLSTWEDVGRRLRRPRRTRGAA